LKWEFIEPEGHVYISVVVIVIFNCN